jgi:hypothetical protein
MLTLYPQASLHHSPVRGFLFGVGMYEDYEGSLFDKFDREHDKFNRKMRTLDEHYFVYAMRRFEQEIAIFVDDLLKNTGITLTGEREDGNRSSGS